MRYFSSHFERIKRASGSVAGCVLIAASTVLGASANAVVPVIDADVFYLSDNMSYSSVNSTYARTFWDLMIGIPLSQKGRTILGWNYDSYSFSDNPGTATTLTVSGMGPVLTWYINNDRTWVLSLTYNLITTGAYSSGSTTSTMTGSSMRGAFGYTPYMSDRLLMGAKLNYYIANFSKEITNDTSIASVSNNRTVIYPSFVITFRFE